MQVFDTTLAELQRIAKLRKTRKNLTLAIILRFH